MREIKFRAWIESTEAMIEVDESSSFTIEFGNAKPLLHMFSNGGESLGEHGEIKDFELMQYTGLKDKNGVEIYEGDIVKHEMHCNFPGCPYTGDPDEGDGLYARIGHITIRPSSGVCINGHQVFSPEDGREPIKTKFGSNPGNWESCSEVIGNIYENPDSIKKAP